MDRHDYTGGTNDIDSGRTVLSDDDPELAAFFDGADLTAALVFDGGKGAIIEDDQADG